VVWEYTCFLGGLASVDASLEETEGGAGVGEGGRGFVCGLLGCVDGEGEPKLSLFWVAGGVPCSLAVLLVWRRPERREAKEAAILCNKL
jgi:hypothetical protein